MIPPLYEGYTIKVARPDLRRFVFRRWHATALLGCFHFGELCLWRARTEEKLISKVERTLRKDALRRGVRDPEIKVLSAGWRPSESPPKPADADRSAQPHRPSPMQSSP